MCSREGPESAVARNVSRSILASFSRRALRYVSALHREGWLATKTPPNRHQNTLQQFQTISDDHQTILIGVLERHQMIFAAA